MAVAAVAAVVLVAVDLVLESALKLLSSGGHPPLYSRNYGHDKLC